MVPLNLILVVCLVVFVPCYRCIDFQKRLRNGWQSANDVCQQAMRRITSMDHQQLTDQWLNNSALMACLLNQELLEGLELHL